MKKNKLIVILPVLVMAIGFIFSNGIEVKAASKKQKTGQAYAKIIKEYQKAYKYAKTGKDYTKLNINREFVYAVQPYGYGDGTPVYRIMDFNKDGNQELFIALERGETATIYDVYTFHNGKAVRLMEGIGYRAGTCSLRKGGIIADHSTGGAASVMAQYHKLPKKSEKLKTIVTLSMDGFSEKPFYKIVKGKKTYITEKQYHKLEKKYEKKYKKIKVTFYKVDSKAIKNVKKGKFNYKGQKSYKVTT